MRDTIYTDTFFAAMRQLAEAKEAFAQGKMSSLDYRWTREEQLAEALDGLSYSYGVTLQKSLNIDTLGEFHLIAITPDKETSEFSGKPAKFGAEFTALLNQYNPRCGVSLTASLTPEDAWCRMNSVDAEKMLEAYLAAAPATKFKVDDLVNWTNDYGVEWPARRVVGIEISSDYDVRYYVHPHDAYWFSIKEAHLQAADEPDILHSGCSLKNLRDRLKEGHQADDIPCLMESFGCNYEAAWSAIADGDHKLALSMLDEAFAKVQTAAIHAPRKATSPGM